MSFKEDFINGKGKTDNIVSVYYDGTNIIEYIQDEFEGVKIRRRDHLYWRLYHYEPRLGCKRLDGDLHYKWLYATKTLSEFNKIKSEDHRKRVDIFRPRNEEEAHLLRTGETLYHNMELKDVSVMSFDIETTGLSSDAEILMISTTYLDQRGPVRQLFDITEFSSEVHMVQAWAAHVRRLDPSVLTGHNIFSFDLKLILERYPDLRLGRGGLVPRQSSYMHKFRRDATQFYEYLDCRIPGREIVDGFFLAIKSDTGRKFEGYGLKPLISSLQDDLSGPMGRLGLGQRSRQQLDAGLIRDFERGGEDWQRARQYCQDDADDSLMLYLYFIPPFFYFTKHMPMGLQTIVNTNSGSQVNNFIIRAYLQEGHSISKAQETYKYEGGLVEGNPGVFRNVFKVDVTSLYPSIILEQEIYDRERDPKACILEMTRYFRESRLADKKAGRKHLSDSKKILINSVYGFMGAGGLNFNYPKGADAVTKRGRDILQQAIEWQSMNQHIDGLVNADTDSISIHGRKLADKDLQARLLNELNEVSGRGIDWEHDGFFPAFLVVKKKNYAWLTESGDMHIKGSGLKATYKESALREFLHSVIHEILLNPEIDTTQRNESLISIYNRYVREIMEEVDTYRWSSKKTVTESVLKAERTNEQNLLNALKGTEYRFGDKFYVYFKEDGKLALADGIKKDACKKRLLEKLYNTAKVLEPVTGPIFLNYKLLRNRVALARL